MDKKATLRDAILYFADFEHCRSFMTDLRWPDGTVKCPQCGSEKVTWLAKPHVWKCYAGHPRPTFSLKTGTIFEDSAIPLEKWLPAAWMLINCKNGISSYELHRALGVTQKTAWFMLQRIRLAMQSRTFAKLGGDIEADESFIGGKAKYAEGKVHTNGLENFWSFLKRALRGTYVSVEPFHLFRYLDEQALRFNTRKMTDAQRFVAVMKQIVGRRLTYQQVTGKIIPETAYG